MDDATRTELEAIKKRVEAATEGPWSASDNHFVIADHEGRDFHIVAEIDCISGRDEDEQFIIHSRTDIPRLLSIIEEQERDNARLIETLSTRAEREMEMLVEVRRNAFDEAIGELRTTPILSDDVYELPQGGTIAEIRVPFTAAGFKELAIERLEAARDAESKEAQS